MPLLTMHLNNLILLLALASFSTSTARVGAMPHQARGHIIITQPQIATPYGSYSRVYARARSLLLNRVFFLPFAAPSAHSTTFCFLHI
uniref:Putative secreted protein n=1 Tax=Anopheles marajoara TaxID=58244 RepID=A0A2M4CA51_9DIPT